MILRMYVDAKERAYFLASQPAAIKQPKQCRQNYFPSPERTIGLNGIELFKESIDLFSVKKYGFSAVGWDAF